jgi:hypothetical protein
MRHLLGDPFDVGSRGDMLDQSAADLSQPIELVIVAASVRRRGVAKQTTPSTACVSDRTVTVRVSLPCLSVRTRPGCIGESIGAL